MGPLGWQETLVIFVLALLIFGPKKLPELGKTIGKALTEFRRASSDLKSTWDREMANLERENESVKEMTRSIQSELSEYNSSYSYDGSPYEPSYDSTAESPYSVGASADQGAEPTADMTPEGGYLPTEYGGGSESPGEDSVAAEAALDPARVQTPTAVPEGEPSNPSPAAG